MIRIRSKVDGFRRCGVPHSSEWKEHEDGRFTPEQLEILENEPMLQVERSLPELKLDAPSEGEMTKAQITARLTELGIEIPRGANKPELQALLEDVLAKNPSPALCGNGDPEAVLPLTRDAEGDLSVSAQAGAAQGGEG